MTDAISIPSMMAGVSTGVVTSIAVLDPSIANIILAIIAAAVVIIPLWFKYKIDKQNKVIAEVVKTSDGMKDELVRVTAKASHATGMIEGAAQAEMKAAVVTAAKAVGAKEQKQKDVKP